MKLSTSNPVREWVSYYDLSAGDVFITRDSPDNVHIKVDTDTFLFADIDARRPVQEQTTEWESYQASDFEEELESCQVTEATLHVQSL